MNQYVWVYRENTLHVCHRETARTRCGYNAFSGPGWRACVSPKNEDPVCGTCSRFSSVPAVESPRFAETRALLDLVMEAEHALRDSPLALLEGVCTQEQFTHHVDQLRLEADLLRLKVDALLRALGKKP